MWVKIREEGVMTEILTMPQTAADISPRLRFSQAPAAEIAEQRYSPGVVAGSYADAYSALLG